MSTLYHFHVLITKLKICFKPKLQKNVPGAANAYLKIYSLAGLGKIFHVLSSSYNTVFIRILAVAIIIISALLECHLNPYRGKILRDFSLGLIMGKFYMTSFCHDLIMGGFYVTYYKVYSSVYILYFIWRRFT